VEKLLKKGGPALLKPKPWILSRKYLNPPKGLKPFFKPGPLFFPKGFLNPKGFFKKRPLTTHIGKNPNGPNNNSYTNLKEVKKL